MDRRPQPAGQGPRRAPLGTLQDRLVSELRLAGATSLEEANAVLAAYLPRHNGRFAVAAADAALAGRSWASERPVESVFCFQYPRRVANDATVSWLGRSLALPRREDGIWAGRAVVLEERLDGSLWVRHRDVSVPVAFAPDRPVVLRARALSRDSAGKPDYRASGPGRQSAVWKPAPDHPWRR